MDRLRPGDWSALDAYWNGHSGIAVRYRDLAGNSDRVLPGRSAYDFRRGTLEAPVLPDAGRHFLAVDPSARLEIKLGRVSHAELGDTRAEIRIFCGAPGALQYIIMAGGMRKGRRVFSRRFQRLAEHIPGMKRPDSMPGMFQRRLFQSWASLRYWRLLPTTLLAPSTSASQSCCQCWRPCFLQQTWFDILVHGFVGVGCEGFRPIARINTTVEGVTILL